MYKQKEKNQYIFSKILGYKIFTQSSILLIMNLLIKITLTKALKLSWKNSTQELQDLYNENFETLKKNLP